MAFGPSSDELEYLYDQEERKDEIAAERLESERRTFLSRIDITPESFEEYAKDPAVRARLFYGTPVTLANNRGLVMRVFYEGSSDERRELPTSSWREQKHLGLVAIVKAQRQELVIPSPNASGERQWTRSATYYGVPVYMRSRVQPDCALDVRRWM